MRTKLTLNLEQLAVDSFETAQAEPSKGDRPTCLNTQCGNYECCA